VRHNLQIFRSGSRAPDESLDDYSARSCGNRDREDWDERRMRFV